jgi:C1A family cysteine protease
MADPKDMSFLMKKSPPDERDWIYDEKHNLPHSDKLIGAPTASPLPEVLDYRPDLLPPRNQGNESSCFAFSVSCVKEWQEKKNVNFNGYFSPQFFYNNRSDTSEDGGMYSRDVMKILKEIGICSESDYPYSGNGIENKYQIPQKCFENARNFRILNFASVKSIDGLKRALYDNGPCLIAFPIFNFGKYPWIKGPDDDELGGHAVVVVAYNKEGFVIRNSWGADWGLSWNGNGYTTYPYSHWGKHWEIYTVIDDPNSVNVYNPVQPVNPVPVSDTNIVLTSAIVGQYWVGNLPGFQMDINIKNNGNNPATGLKFKIDCDKIAMTRNIAATDDPKVFTLPDTYRNGIPPGGNLRWGFFATGKKPIVSIA